jgi:hypothetical protein
MSWEKFTRYGRSLKPKISIRGNSQIGFNNAAINDFKLSDYKFVVLYFDKDSKRIGIKPTNDKNEEGACKLRVRDNFGASIAARSYIEFYKLNTLKNRRLDAELDSKDKMITAVVTD